MGVLLPDNWLCKCLNKTDYECQLVTFSKIHVNMIILFKSKIKEKMIKINYKKNNGCDLVSIRVNLRGKWSVERQSIRVTVALHDSLSLVSWSTVTHNTVFFIESTWPILNQRFPTKANTHLKVTDCAMGIKVHLLSNTVLALLPP